MELNELRSRMHLDIMEFEKKTGLLVSDVVILRAGEIRRPAVRAIHTDVRLP